MAVILHEEVGKLKSGIWVEFERVSRLVTRVRRIARGFSGKTYSYRIRADGYESIIMSVPENWKIIFKAFLCSCVVL